jgi:hypothetical protein
VKAVIEKHRQYLLLNIANEAGNGSVAIETFGKKYAAIIKRCGLPA